ncbi:ATP-dependent helicase [Candidatus Margulisiibacteriota bacterium]
MKHTTDTQSSSVLNPQQQEAVQTINGPLLIIAGAGSGKTRVLTERIKHLILDHQVPSEQIMAVTFTNKAAAEMRTRLPQNYNYPWISTFHSMCHKILRIESDRSFVIFDAQDQLSLIKNICKKMEINVQFKPSSILSAISNAKNQLLTPESYASHIGSLYEETVAKVFEAYQKGLKTSNALDFDDLLNHTVNLFQNDSRTLNKYQDQFLYMSVDEYQDTNHSQYILTKLLSAKHKNICVVGDSDQNIYSWRGANIQNILNFEKDYQDAKVILLEQNYRSTKTILHIANSVISSNINRKPKNLWTDNPEGDLTCVYTAFDEKDEASFLAGEAVKHKNKKDVVILYRTNAQSRTLEDIFVRRSIPYRIVGGVKFYLRKEIKDTLAYLRYLYNKDDLIALERIKKLPAFKKFIEDSATILLKQKASNIIEQVLNITKYRDKLEKKATDETISRVENINELISVAKDFTGLEEFLAYTTLVTDVDELEDQTDAITLMTLHSAKGLEFPYVYIAGCEEGILPHYRSQLENDLLEEERRLFYVGITRAQKNITFTLANKRLLFGETWYNEPTRFLKDIPDSLIQRSDFDTGHETEEQEIILTPVTVYIRGDKVHHKRFGEGVIQAAKGDDLTINFSSGDKLLSAKYAPLKRL